MSARDWFRAIAKEVRAVAPVWAATALAMTAVKSPPGTYEYLLRGIGYAAFFVGPSAVGALAFGHDFQFGTWPMVLTLPVSRRRLLVMKFGVLAVLLSALTVVGRWLGPLSGPREMGEYAAAMPMLLGAFVAPWLTLATRRAVGGSALAVALPGVLLVLGQIAGVSRASRDVDAVVARFLLGGVAAACVAGAILGWRRFMTLEVVDGGAPDARDARAGVSEPRTTVSRASPTWNLFVKELRLQRLTLAMGAFYTVTYVAGVLTMSDWLGLGDGAIVAVLTVIYGSAVSLVAGAIASAEERQLGTVDEQLLLPVAVRWQWAVKAATAIALALAIAYGLPRLLTWILPPPRNAQAAFVGGVLAPTFVGVAVLLAAVALYVSSICRSTMTAVMLTFPVFVSIAVLFREIADPVTRAAYASVHSGNGAYLRFGDPLGTAAVVIVVLLLTALTVRLALSNHRYTDRSLLRIAAHAALFLAALTAGLAALGALGLR